MSGRTQYDDFYNEYLAVRELKVSDVNEYTLFEQISSRLKDKDIIDLACGDGSCTRKLKKLDANKVIGVDISEAMINIAKDIELSGKLGIEYINTPVETMNIRHSSFDIATAFYLLHYAKSKKQLGDMLKNIFTVLKNGGEFLSINSNTSNEFWLQPNYLNKYGVGYRIDGPLKSGSSLYVSLTNENASVEVEIYHYTKEDYRQASEEAGFIEIEFLPLSLPEYMMGAPYWDRLLKLNPMHLMKCKKPE